MAGENLSAALLAQNAGLATDGGATVVGQCESGIVGAGTLIGTWIVLATSVRSRTCLSNSDSTRGFGSHGSGRPGAGSSMYRGTRWTCRCGTELPSSW